MANNGNLKSGNVHGQTPEEAQINGEKGGIASGEARRDKKMFKALAQDMLNMASPDKYKSKVIKLFPELNEEEITTRITLFAHLVDKALATADTKAFEVIRDTAGEKPTDKSETKNMTEVFISEEELKKHVKTVRNMF